MNNKHLPRLFAQPPLIRPPGSAAAGFLCLWALSLFSVAARALRSFPMSFRANPEPGRALAEATDHRSSQTRHEASRRMTDAAPHGSGPRACRPEHRSSSTKLRKRLQNQLCAHHDRRFQATVNGAFIGEEAVNAAGSFPVSLLRPKLQPHMNAPDDQYVVLQFDLTLRFGDKTTGRCIDLTRLQRASKGSCKSAGGCGDNVIQRRRVRLQSRRWHLIMLGDCAVNPKCHRLRFRRQIRSANRPLHPFNSDFGTINDFRHVTS